MWIGRRLCLSTFGVSARRRGDNEGGGGGGVCATNVRVKTHLRTRAHTAAATAAAYPGAHLPFSPRRAVWAAASVPGGGWRTRGAHKESTGGRTDRWVGRRIPLRRRRRRRYTAVGRAKACVVGTAAAATRRRSRRRRLQRHRRRAATGTAAHAEGNRTRPRTRTKFRRPRRCSCWTCVPLRRQSVTTLRGSLSHIRTHIHTHTARRPSRLYALVRKSVVAGKTITSIHTHTHIYIKYI